MALRPPDEDEPIDDEEGVLLGESVNRHLSGAGKEERDGKEQDSSVAVGVVREEFAGLDPIRRVRAKVWAIMRGFVEQAVMGTQRISRVSSTVCRNPCGSPRRRGGGPTRTPEASGSRRSTYSSVQATSRSSMS